MQATFQAAARGVGLAEQPWAPLLVELLALLLGGFVAGSFARRWQAVHGSFAAAAYIFVSATLSAVAEASTAYQLGMGALPPLDFPRLAASDLIALSAAAVGGWLSGQSYPTR